MPGVDYYSNTDNTSSRSAAPVVSSSAPGVYYNARLDPKNYLEGPLSDNPATRLRQMLARPGIVVRANHFFVRSSFSHIARQGCPWYLRRYKCALCSRSWLYLHVPEVRNTILLSLKRLTI